MTHSDKMGHKVAGEDHEITGQIITQGSFYQFTVFDYFTLHGVYCIIFLLLTAQFDIIIDFNTHCKLQEPTVVNEAGLNPFSSILFRNGHAATTIL